jgi:acetyl esterase/lipase
LPVHPAIAQRLPLLDGIDSFAAGFADPQLRARLDAFADWPDAPAPPDVRVDAAEAPGPHGPVPVRVYRPHQPPTAQPALVWMHGGAFRAGDLDMIEADGVARELCARAGAVVVSVDYRLAVDGVHYPVPHDDVVAAVRWARDSADELGIDPTRLSIGGASAGGNLAGGAALRLRDDDGWVPAALVLAYATLHAVVPAPAAELAALLDDIPRILRFLPADRTEITTNYVGGPESRADGYAMPGLGVLDGLCPTVLVNAEYDDLRASSQEFAAQLAVAGVDVRQVTVRGMLHGFLNMPAVLEPVDRVLGLLAGVIGDARS